MKWPESMESEKGIYTFKTLSISGKEKPGEGEDKSQASVVSRGKGVAVKAQYHRAEQKNRKIHVEVNDKCLAKGLPIEENMYKNRTVRG